MDVVQIESNDVQIVVDQVGQQCQKLFQDFLEDCHDGDTVKYLKPARDLLKPERNTLSVSMRDVERHNQVLAQNISEEYYRVYPYLCIGLRNFIKDHTEASFNKECFIAFMDVDAKHKVRDMTTVKIGSLIRITGQVVRTHPVHPELILGHFVCTDCQTEIKNVEQQFKFTQPNICRNPICQNRTRFVLNASKSQFVDFQKVRVQEIQSELPRGCIPRSVEVILRAEAVEAAQPGDRCDFIGTLIVIPDVGSIQLPGARAETATRYRGQEQTGSEGVQGLRSLGVRELNYRLAFLASSVIHGDDSGYRSSFESTETLSPDAIKDRMSEAEWDTIYKMSTDKSLYENLINSLFPTIHGSEEIKRGILLQLFGGVAKHTPEGTSLRGDINICIVGDPSTAKSQFLKQVADFCPRSVYTSGKASSAAGLTAAVVRDEESSEFVIEAGALMLSDNGVCCIDEFDKMEVHDQVAIHEAMEQQTISITKAGVKATLNARTSILAAANPINGRYDRTKSLKKNIQLSAPIMSRFDLFFIIVDDCNEVTDYAIARRIIDLHSKQDVFVHRVYGVTDIARYIAFARLFKPKLTDESAEFLVEHYRHLRQRDSSDGATSSWRITVRQLESMIRLSEATARLHCADHVLPKHVKEAYRLLNKSIIRVDQPDIHFEDSGGMEDEEEEDKENIQDGSNIVAPTVEEETVSKKRLKISYDEYHSLANVLLHQLQQAESSDDVFKRSDLVNWYLEEISGEIESQEELLERRQIVEKVVDRLTHKDHVIIPLSRTGLSAIPGGESETTEDPILVVHPNYVINS